MNTRPIVPGLLVSLLLASAGCPARRGGDTASPPAPAPRAREAGALAPLAFMEGAWRSTRPDGSIVEERWTAPRAGMMLATNQTIRGEETVFFEFLRIEAVGDGIFYYPRPQGNEAATFRLSFVEAGVAVFESPENDAPSRITYRRDGDRMVVVLEGREEGQAKKEEIVFERQRR